MNNQQVFHTTGAKRDKRDRRDYRVASIMSVAEVPKQVFNLDEQFPPKNQFTRGSCTSQAQAHHKERQEKRKSSARFIMALTKDLEGNNDYGAYTRNTFIIANKVGICAEELYPEPGPEMSWDEYIDVTKIPQKCYEDAREHKSASFWRVNLLADEIKNVLIQKKNSIVCSMEWFKEFNNPVAGVLPTSFSQSAGGHAVELKGWDDFKEQWIFKNSWGQYWDGAKGYFYMPFSLASKVIWDLWCSLDVPADLPVDIYYGERRTWASYLRERSFAFNPWIKSKIGRFPNNREIKGLAYGYWSFDSIFKGKVGDNWLKITKPEALKQGLIDSNENLIK